MKYNRLGTSELMVSEVCLGTMTWGIQNTESDAHEQLDYARSRGVNFIDTAEFYPVPPTAPGQVPGTTEKYIGSYLSKHPEARSELIIATKITGYLASAKSVAHRSEPPLPEPYPPARHDAASVRAACESSLQRMNTTYIDLYQLHWPDRYVPLFGQREYRVEKERDDAVPFTETVRVLKELVEEGKIRYWGLSNESTFGVCEFVRVADEMGAPRPISIQNPYCLLNRAFECELAEACSPRNFNIGLLPWSVLAGGTLSGKYQKFLQSDEGDKEASKGIEDARFVMFPYFQFRFMTKDALEATAKYMDLAKEYDMSVATLAQAFCKSRWYIPSTIIGATKMHQLKENIDAFEMELNAKLLQKIDDIHNQSKDLTIGV